MERNQRDLFDTEPAPWELDDQSEARVARVVFPEGVDGEFDYFVPESLTEDVQPGKRLRVPLGRGNRTVVCYCINVHLQVVTRQLKPVTSVLDKRVLLSPHMLKLTAWMSSYYLARWGRVLEAVVPAGVREGSGTREKVFLQVSGEVIAQLPELKLPQKQAAALTVLAASEKALTVDELAEQTKCTIGPINALRKKGLVTESRRRVHVLQPDELVREESQDLTLNDRQRDSLRAIDEAIERQRHDTFLLHGVTGSGKTEVYIKAIEKVITAGRQAIVLVPEISLTPQTQRRFKSRFEHVAVLHSHLTDADRNWHWKNIADGNVQVIVGARSAVFAPTQHLGLIVIDEEHDGSFKQSIEPRYHARLIAQKRAELERVPLVLGSATPSLESWHQAQTGAFTLLSMPDRVSELPLPKVDTIDMREEFQNRFHRGSISRHLADAMKKALQAGGQVILLLNRRGFSTHIQCPACGEVVKCAECDIALTHHREGEKVVCHYCDYESAAPQKCPHCKFENIRYGGLGTQRLEAEVRQKFPNHTCLRMDSDTMKRPGSHESAFSRFRTGEVKILLGTQMIAKGLDFPNVTLVGVINADTGLHLPDFRAGERAFQLITQVAGRTGRSEKGGRVLVQSFDPDHPSIAAARHHDYLQFANHELPNRKSFAYPPFGCMARIVVRGSSEQLAEGTASAIAQHIQNRVAKDFEANPRPDLPPHSVRVLGPAPAPIAKLRGLYRFHMLLQCPELDLIRPAVLSAREEIKLVEDVQWIVDIDPIEML
ncbi:MAG: primosomal protein N' [Planctomycetales bacterium]|nr:primosomal protein N' [Planctomycetales bacterium]